MASNYFFAKFQNETNTSPARHRGAGRAGLGRPGHCRAGQRRARHRGTSRAGLGRPGHSRPSQGRARHRGASLGRARHEGWKQLFRFFRGNTMGTF